VKPGPIVIMVLLILLGLWLVWLRPNPMDPARLRDGARTVEIRIGQAKGVVEVVPEPGTAHTDPNGASTYRLVWNDGHESGVLTRDELASLLGPRAMAQLEPSGANDLFRVFNITSWASMVWIAIGLGGQVVFSCRFIVQWIISEKQRRSVIPEAFWWISLGGAVCLFVYFVWRQDIVGVLGQSTGLVIYARNLRLIHKQRRRDTHDAPDQPSPVPTKGSSATTTEDDP